MKAGIAIDAWKLPIFKAHLQRAGYTYTEGPGLSKGTLFLYVDTEDFTGLHATVQAANYAAALSRAN